MSSKMTGRTFRICLTAIRMASEGKKVFYVTDNRESVNNAYTTMFNIVSNINNVLYLNNIISFEKFNDGVVEIITLSRHENNIKKLKYRGGKSYFQYDIERK